MFKNFFLIILLSFCFIKSANSHSHYPITKDDPLKIEAGKLLYNQYCASCHQVNLAGAKNWKGFDEDGHRKAPPLNGTGHTWHHSDELLHKIIKYGFAKLIKNYEGKMIGFEDQLSDKEIDSILAYVKSFWPIDKYEYQINMSK